MKQSREKSDRFFPEQPLQSNGSPNPDFGKTVALYLGLKLVQNGSIAIFCGKKSTAINICEKAADFIDRNLPLQLPHNFSEQNEINRLYCLHVKNLGEDASATMSAKYGIFSHQGNIPHGIRLSVEHAMRKSLILFVVCTSTLAQGVNLPIRYLIVTSVYQGMERIKIRDFHNLMGQAGRSGMHTEGSILFADPIVYDKRRSQKDNWRWRIVKELLDPTNLETCTSSLCQLIPLIIHNNPAQSNDKKKRVCLRFCVKRFSGQVQALHS